MTYLFSTHIAFIFGTPISRPDERWRHSGVRIRSVRRQWFVQRGSNRVKRICFSLTQPHARGLEPSFEQQSALDASSAVVLPLAFHVDGLKCGSCVSRCESAIRSKLPGAQVSVNLLTKTASVQDDFHNGQEISRMVQAAMRGAGFSARPAVGMAHAKQVEESARKSPMFLGIALMLASALSQSICCGSSTLAIPISAVHALSLGFVLVFVSVPLRPFFNSGVNELKIGMFSMSGLVLLSVVAQVSVSVFGWYSGIFVPRFHETVLLLTFVQLGRFLETRIRAFTTASAAQSLSRLQPRTCVLLAPGDSPQEVPLSIIEIGNVVLVPSLDRFPVDGVLLGCAHRSVGDRSEALGIDCDFSILTGETEPTPVLPGEHVWSGGVNLSTSPVRIEALCQGKDSQLARMLVCVERAMQVKSETARLADQAASVLGKVTVLISLVVAVLYLSLPARVLPPSVVATGYVGGLLMSASVLAAACPCAMSIAVPIISLVALSVAVRRGILYRDGAALEACSGDSPGLIAFDKTGTLTTGRMDVSDVKVAQGVISIPDLVRVAAFAEINVNHPVAQSIVRYAKELDLFPSSPQVSVMFSDVVVGRGVQNSKVPLSLLGKTGFGTFSIGSQDWIQELAGVDAMQTWVGTSGLSNVFVYCPCLGGIIGRFTLNDELSTTCDEIASIRLAHANPALAIVSGDSQPAVSRVAHRLGIGCDECDIIIGCQSPGAKASVVERLRTNSRGRPVYAVGDGVNDGLFLAAADVGIAVGRPNARVNFVAASAADVLLPSGKLALIADALVIGRHARAFSVASLVWACLYNFVALLRSSGLLGGRWFVPAHRAALWMAVSSCVSLCFPVLMWLTLQARLGRSKGLYQPK